MRPTRALVDIVLALTSFVVVGVAVSWLSAFVPAGIRLPLMVVSQGIVVLAVTGLLLAWRDQRWRDIGLVPPMVRDVGRAVIAFAVCMGLNLVLIYALHWAFPDTVAAHSQQLEIIARQLSYSIPFPALIAVLALVGVYEELFARGLLLQRCRSLAGGTWIPVMVSSVLFGLGHLYQGWIGVAQTTLIGIVLAVLTLRWRTLWPAILAHALLDTASIALIRSMGGGGTSV